MDAYTTASRAVITAYAKKVIRPFEIGAIVVFAALMLGTAWLSLQISAWWWLTLIIIIPYGAIGSVIWLIAHTVIDRLTPVQTAAQKQAVAEFIVSLEKVADKVGMTRFGLLLSVIRTVMQPNAKNMLSEFTDESKALKRDFQRVVSAFDS